MVDFNTLALQNAYGNKMFSLLFIVTLLSQPIHYDYGMKL